MKTIICNDYDSCIHASINIVHENGEIYDVDPKNFLDDKGCSIDVLKVSNDAIDHIGTDFILLNYVDGCLEGSFTGNDYVKLMHNKEEICK